MEVNGSAECCAECKTAAMGPLLMAPWSSGGGHCCFSQSRKMSWWSMPGHCATEGLDSVGASVRQSFTSLRQPSAVKAVKVSIRPKSEMKGDWTERELFLPP